MTSQSAKAILIRATENRLISEDETKATYEGTYDPTWNIGVVPNGGYTLAHILRCTHDFVKRRIGKRQENLFSCNATYLGKVSAELPFTVEIRLLKPGKNTSILEADLIQKSGKQASSILCTRVTCIYADFASIRSDPITGQLSFLPNDPYANVAPLQMDHNDRSNEEPWYSKHKIPTKVVDERAQKYSQEVEKKLVEIQSMHFPKEDVSKEDMMGHNIAAIAFFSDMTAEPKRMMPPKGAKITEGYKEIWMPTMSLSIEIAHPIPLSYPIQNVVTKAKTTFLHQGHFCFEVEIWSHPSDALKLDLPKGVNSILLAVSRQTALIMSMAVNKRKSSKL